MSADEGVHTFAERILDSSSSELRQMAAAGLAPLPLPELMALQVELTKGSEAPIADAARRSLSEMDPRIVASVIDEGPDPDVLRYFGGTAGHPVVIESILRLRQVPRDLLSAMAGKLEPDQQELLLFRQDAIVEEPAILDALDANPKLSPYSKRRIAEYREHLVRREPAPVAPAPADFIDSDEADVDIEKVEKIREEFEAIEATTAEGDLDNIWRASEVKIRALPVAVRMNLARGATPLLRRILIRDQNPNVALAIMRFSPITEAEVERIALSRVILDDVLTHISNSKTWIRRYRVVHALCQNPRTPVNVGVRLLSRLSARHLLHLSRNRNVSDAMRARSLRLYRIKIQ